MVTVKRFHNYHTKSVKNYPVTGAVKDETAFLQDRSHF